MPPAQQGRPAPEAEKNPAAPALAATAGFRTWRDSTGKFTIEGKLLSNTDGKVTIQKSDGSKVAIPLQRLSAPDRAYVNSLGEAESAPPAGALAGGDTEQIGSGGWVFRKEGRGPVLGFRYRLGQWDNGQCLAPIEPIFDARIPLAGPSVVIARSGYAVGALNVDAKRFVNAVQIVFMRLKPGGGLDPSDSYTSPWIGVPTGRATTTIGGSGATVIGIYGRHGAVLEAIGLILRGE